MIKRYISVFTAVLAGSVLLVSPADVRADSKVSDIHIKVLLNYDGSADITQELDTYTDRGNEFYLHLRDNGYLSYSDLRVSDQTREYDPVGEWNLDWDFDQTAYSCGIHPVEDGSELCWGISEYGRNHYTLTYHTENQLVSYDDYDGFLCRFIDDLGDFYPTNATIDIAMADETSLSDEQAQLWAFGFEGDVEFVDGAIHASTAKPLEQGNHMTLMLALDKDLVAPNLSCEEAFGNTVELVLADPDYMPYIPLNNPEETEAVESTPASEEASGVRVAEEDSSGDESASSNPLLIAGFVAALLAGVGFLAAAFFKGGSGSSEGK